VTEEYKLFEEYKKTKDKKIRDELVKRYIYLAKILAYKTASIGVEYDDLYQIACMGIVFAVERFDIDRGIMFSTFATSTIVGEIKRFLRDKVRCIKVPRNLYEILCKAEYLQKRTGNLSVPELAKKLDVPQKTIEEAYKAWDDTFLKSLEDEAYKGEDSTISETIGFEDDGFTVIENRDFLDYCMSKLEKEEKEIFTRRFFEGKTQRKTAEEMGVSQMYISRAEKKITDKIKDVCQNEL